eukprot:CAMPEP_0168463656 /NCGR_PEP_ID=MMETSP0228-20121227/55173_1 /TAXON_ID=133427 /ORGANISM="Protoceratium reticulatum, Strain CCCM 535 (=CCMP 1889)" /LENGTH=253 /DNA_ID=CAMNT_0008479129 /DNA_START=70 /DNA_END=828 /DNA_ORIENTATION=+
MAGKKKKGRLRGDAASTDTALESPKKLRPQEFTAMAGKKKRGRQRGDAVSTDAALESPKAVKKKRRGEEAPVADDELAIWAAHVAISAPSAAGGRAGPGQGQERMWTPSQEFRRISAVKALRSKLVRLSAEHNSGDRSARPPVLTFERWLARWALRRDPARHAEPIIPADGVQDNALIRDLERAMPLDAAWAVGAALTEAAAAAASKLAEEEPDVDAASDRVQRAARAVRSCASAARLEPSAASMESLARAAD